MLSICLTSWWIYLNLKHGAKSFKDSSNRNVLAKNLPVLTDLSIALRVVRFNWLKFCNVDQWNCSICRVTWYKPAFTLPTSLLQRTRPRWKRVFVCSFWWELSCQTQQSSSGKNSTQVITFFAWKHSAILWKADQWKLKLQRSMLCGNFMLYIYIYMSKNWKLVVKLTVEFSFRCILWIFT